MLPDLRYILWNWSHLDVNKCLKEVKRALHSEKWEIGAQPKITNHGLALTQFSEYVDKWLESIFIMWGGANRYVAITYFHPQTVKKIKNFVFSNH